MKNKKWLLIIVMIIFLINLLFFLATRSGRVDQLVEDKILQRLEEQLNADVSFEYFTFNDRQLNVSGVKILSRQDGYQIHLKQIFVEYSLMELIFSNFQDLRSIKSIKIYKPMVIYNHKFEISKKEKKSDKDFMRDLLSFDIPDMKKFFRKLEIYDGTIDLNLKHQEFNFHNIWNNIDITLTNEKVLTGSLVAKSQNSTWLGKATVSKKRLKDFSFEITKCELDTLNIKALDELDFQLSGNINFQQDSLKYSLLFSHLLAEKNNKRIKAEQINLAGNETNLKVDFLELEVDEIPILAQFTVSKPFAENPWFSGVVKAKDVKLNRYLKEFAGHVEISMDLSGYISDPQIISSIKSDYVGYKNHNVSDVAITSSYSPSKLDFELHNLIYQDNKINATGSWNSDDGAAVQIIAPRFKYRTGDFKALGNIKASLQYNKDLKTSFSISNLIVNYGNYEISDLSLSAETYKGTFDCDIANKGKSLSIIASGDFQEKLVETKIKFSRFNTNNILGSHILPLTSGYLNLKMDEKLFTASSSVRLYDQDYGRLDGRFNSEFSVNLQDSSSFLSIKSKHARFNYEDIGFELIANGDLKSIRTEKFVINDDLQLEAWLNLDPVFSYGGRVRGEQIKLKEYLTYFTDNYTTANLEGRADFDLSYNSADYKDVGGYLNIDDIYFEDEKPLDLKLKLSGIEKRIIIDEMHVYSNKELITKLTGKFAVVPELCMNLHGEIPNFPLQNFLENSEGNISGDFDLNWLNNKYDFNIRIGGNNCKLSGIDFSSLILDFSQTDSLLILHNFRAKNDNLFNLSASGRLGVNAFTSEYFLLNESEISADTLQVSFQGDLLKLMELSSNEVVAAGSNCDIDLSIGVNEGGLFARRGRFALSKGFLDLKSQPQIIERLNFICDIRNNQLDIEKFSFRIGEGKANITNEIRNDELDIYVANLNLGVFLLKTNNEGLLVHIPGFMPSNSPINAVIAGRSAQYATLSGPMEDLLVTADIYVSNGDVIFPAHTENLLKLINTFNKQKELTKPFILPLSLDVRLFLGDNVRYVTYPANLKIAPGSYIYMQYLNEEFSIPDASISCYEGTVDILGTTLETEQVQVNINQSIEGVKVAGVFSKTAADGTVVTLTVRRDEERMDEKYIRYSNGSNGNGLLGGRKEKVEPELVELEFSSDNSSDSMLDILSLLRYGRRTDELTDSQTGSLIQDEVIQLAGIGIESAFLDPLISPLENWVRKALRLDYFRLQTDIIQNIFSNYRSLSGNDQSKLLEDEDEQNLSKFDTDMFLNNLSINMGRYIARKVFLDYEAKFAIQNEYISNSDLGVYHYFTVRYSLPWKFNLSYEYSIDPFRLKSSHQLQLERSFRFY